MSSYVSRRSQRYHHDWSTSHLASLRGERGLALNNTMCGKTHDKELVFEVAIMKPPSHLCEQFTIMRHISDCLCVCETTQQNHNCDCRFLTLIK